MSGRSAEEDLYNVFLGRSALMGWSRMGSSDSPRIPLLWGMNEAELTPDVRNQIGFVQVGLDHGLGMAIAPLVQGTDDSLRRFGEVAVAAWEVTAIDIARGQASNLFDLIEASSWFPRSAHGPVGSVVTLAVDRGDEQSAADILKDLNLNSGPPFDFGPLVDASADRAVGRDWPPIRWVARDTGIAVTTPDWSPGAVGWVAARVADSALSLDSPPRHLSVRVSHTRP